MIFEKGIFYSLIHFKKTKEIQKYNENELKYGPININRKEEAFVLYLKSKCEEFKRIYNDLPENNKKRNEIMIYIKEIEEILNEN